MPNQENEKPQQTNDPKEQPESPQPVIPLNQFGVSPALIPVQQKHPYYPYIYDSYGQFQTVNVLPPDFYPQQEQKLPPIDQPIFTVSRKLNHESPREENSVAASDNSLSLRAIKNHGNKNLDIPDAEIPPFPFPVMKI